MTLPQLFIDALHLPPEASSASRDIDALHLLVISLTMIGSIGVATLVAWFVFKYRRIGKPRPTPRIEASAAQEIGVAVGILALFVSLWWIGFRQYVAVSSAPANCANVYVTAKQWMWKFTYEDGTSANDVLTVPVGRPVKLIMTSRDVIHSFYVPAFRLKHDVLPGRYVTLWFDPTELGDFDVFCAEYCGLQHSDMHGTIRVVSLEKYAEIVLQRQTDRSGATDLAARGAEVARKRQCLACHATDDNPPSDLARTGPPWSRLYGSWQALTDGRRVFVDDEYLTRSMMEPNVDIVNGYRASMPSYAGVVDAAETAAIVAYIRSLASDGHP